MKKVWKDCFNEFKEWFCAEWKKAWGALKESILGLVRAIFQWIYTVVGSLVGGLWKMVLKPMCVYIQVKVIEFIEKI